MSEDRHGHRDRIRFGDSSREMMPAPGPPLRLVVIGDFSPSDSADEPVSTRIDKDSFNEVLRSLCPSVSIYVPGRISQGDRPVLVEFEVRDLKSFHPMSICQGEAFRALLDDRRAVLDLRDGRLTMDEFEKRPASASSLFGTGLQAAAPRITASHAPPAPAPIKHPVSPGADLLDSILDMVEAPAGGTQVHTESEGGARIQDYISAMFEGSQRRQGVERAEADRLVREFDRMLSARLNDVLRSAEFGRLEAAWRGLKFLVDRTDFRNPIQIEVISAKKDRIPAALAKLVSGVETSESGYDVILMDFEFRNTPEDLATLKRSAELAVELRAPAVANVGPVFFRKTDFDELTRVPLLRTYMETEPFVKWDSFRNSEASRWVALALNRFLLRARYTGGTARTPFAFEEEGEGLWGNPMWAVGSLIVRSFSSTEWCGHITGMRGGGLIEDLPVRPAVVSPGEIRHIPLEGMLRRGTGDDFHDAGFLALQCVEDQDVAVLQDSPTTHRPERYPDFRDTEESRQRAKLAYQLVACRIARQVENQLARLRGGSPANLQRELAESLARWIGPGRGESESVSVELAESTERVGYLDLLIRIRPGPQVWPLQAGIDMQIPMRISGT